MIKTTEEFLQQPFGIADEAKKATTKLPKTTIDIVSSSDMDSNFFRVLEEKGILLNEKQVEAVRSTEGPVLTLAGAGSGKTSVLTTRVSYLVDIKRIDPKKIMLLTFTVKAAEELKTRIANLPGLSPYSVKSLVTGTFHSVFLKLLRSRGFNQNILSSEKYKQVLIKKILREFGLKDDYNVETILSMISLEKNNLRRPKDVRGKTKIEKEFKQIYEQYEEIKVKSNYIDFDDILLEIYYLLKEQDKLLSMIQNRFEYILVDEFQDTSEAQYQILKLIAQPRNNLFVAGDDDQAIYGWRTGSNDIILSFPNEFKDTKVVNLETNYRSNPFIVGLGNEIIRGNKKRYKKELHTVIDNGVKPFYHRPENTFDEANVVLHSIKEKVDNGERVYSDFCILFRTHSVSRSILDQLTLHDIPFVKYGMSQPFYEHTIIKPVIDHLRLIVNPNDMEAFNGILPTLYLNRDEFMAFTHKQLNNYSNKQANFQSLLHLLLMHPKLKSYQVNKINERIALLKKLSNLDPKVALKELISGEGKYTDYLKDNDRQTFTMNKEIIDEMLDELIDSANRFSDNTSYVQFIQKSINKHIEMEQLKRIPNMNAISLMSIHNAKGLEFPCVFIIGASEGIIPHSSSLKDAEDRISKKKGKEKIIDSIEEERRLLYVAITRVKKNCILLLQSYSEIKN